MERYIQSFETAADLRAAITDNKLGAPFVAYLEDEQRIVWNEVPEPPAPDYSAMPLTFEILSGGNIYWVDEYEEKPDKSIQYSINGGSWEEMPRKLQVNTGDIVQFRGNNESYNYTFLLSDAGTGKYNIYGNIMSLIDSTGYTGVTSVTAGAFACLFSNYGTGPSLMANINSAEHLILPATTLDEGCYGGMFNGCTGLTTAPELPATTLAENCYGGMFSGCRSLTTAPVLPATTLVHNCYDEMFYNCTNLNYIKCLALTNRYSTEGTMTWLYNVSPTGTFVKHPDATWESGSNGIPTGWTVIDATI